MKVGRPIYYETAQELQDVAEDYLLQCEKKGKNPTITGLAYYLGFESRQSFYDYEERGEFSYIIKRLRLAVESGYESRLGEAACTGAIFALKNMGWKDKTEQDLKVEGGVQIVMKKVDSVKPDYETK